MKALLILATCTAALSGCTTVLGPDNSVASTLRSPHSVETTYRNIVSVARDCYPHGVAIDSNYFPNANEADIRIAASNENATFEWIKLQIKPQYAGSRVKVTRYARLDQFDAALPEWIDGKAANCPNSTRPMPRPPGSETSQQNMPAR